MEKDILDNNIGDTELPAETIKYPPALLEARDQYISSKVQALYASYGVEDLEELISSIKGEPEALELDTKVLKIKELRDRYISSAFHLVGIRGLLDPTVQYEEEVIWSSKEIGSGVQNTFFVDSENNIVVQDNIAGNVYILDGSKNYKPTKIFSAENLIDGNTACVNVDLENSILIQHWNFLLLLLEKSKGFNTNTLLSEEDMIIINGSEFDLENNIWVNDSEGNLYFIDRTKDNKRTMIWSSKDMGVRLCDVRFDLENNIMVKDSDGNVLYIDRSKDNSVKMICSKDEMGENIWDYKFDLKNNIFVEDTDGNLHFIDRTKDNKRTTIWSQEDRGVGINKWKLDLENNIVLEDNEGNLHILDSSNDYKSTEIWSGEDMGVLVQNITLDLANNIVVVDCDDNVYHLDSSNGYKRTWIASVKEAFRPVLDSKGNIIIISDGHGQDGFSFATLSILKPKKNK